MKQGRRVAAIKTKQRKPHAVKFSALEVSDDAPEERVRRLYAGDGGPLVQWLLDEARRRRIDLKDMAKEVGVTYGYIHQLRTGLREKPSLDFARGCASFLGVAPVVAMLVGGVVGVRDFSTRALSEAETVDRALRRMQDDPHLRASIPVDLARVNAEGKRALALLYADTSGHDIFGVRHLPDIVRWLQRAAEIHDENAFAAAAGHRDTAARAA